MHLLIPFAYRSLQDRQPDSQPDCQTALARLTLPHLQRLLGLLTTRHDELGASNTLIPPHERALAAAYGILKAGVTPDGQVPWGAWHAAKAGHPVLATDHWAVITPCHWAVQTNHITMVAPRALNLEEEESRQLMATLQPFFEEDGIHLRFDTATRWLATGAVFAGLATASPYRVLGARVDDWIPKGDAARGLRRLQQEVQMLLYTHPLSDARASRGLPAVNSFWVSGTGALPPGFSLAAASNASAQVVCPHMLRDAAVADNWPAWGEAWQRIDATECAAALAALQSGQPVTVTLCGDKNARSFSGSTPKGWGAIGQNLKQAFKRPPSVQKLLAALDSPHAP